MPTIDRRAFTAFLAAACLATPASAAEEVFSDWRGNAIRGVDPVAYFTEGRVVEGSSDHTHEWRGARWRFASEENRRLFAENPEKYAPQYGGFCAWAVAHGGVASTDPEAWDIVDGKLYLNYSRSFQDQWRADARGYIVRGDENWPKLIQ